MTPDREPRSETPTRADILGALARGYCHEGNTHKQMDSDLLNKQADEVMTILAAAQPKEGAAPLPVEPDCTCHPDDFPPRPCPKKYAYSDCMRAALEAAREEINRLLSNHATMHKMMEQAELREREERKRADSWVTEARNLARECGLEDDESNGSVADWKFIKGYIARSKERT